MSGERVGTRTEGAVRVLTLSRPPGNVLDLATLSALREGVTAAAADEAVRALVIASSVEGYFSTGLDLAEWTSLPEDRGREPFEAMVGAYRALLAFPKPAVAAMSGTAILGGWIVAMGCDWRILAEGAKVALSEVRVGLSPTAALISRLAALSSDPRAVKEMVLRGKALTAAEALEASLVDRVLPAAEVLPDALSLAKRLAKSPPRAFADVKRALNEAADDPVLWRRSMEAFAAVYGGAEAREGISAQRDKRRPRWEAA